MVLQYSTSELTSELRSISRHLGRIAIVEFIETSRFNNSDTERGIRSQSTRYHQARSATPNDHVVVGARNVGDAEMGADQLKCVEMFCEVKSVHQVEGT